MRSRSPRAALVGAALALLASRADGAVFATFDAAQFRANGFAFSDFNDFDALDASGDVIRLNIANDLDLSNGLFGGIGSDLVADFDAATTRIDVNLTINPANVASGFNVVLIDNDGPGAGEEYQFFFSLTGQPTGVPITLSQSLVNPGPVFRQTAFNQNPGDEVQNYGLRQVQVQSVFGGSDPLRIDLGSVQIIDPNDPTLIEFNTTTYAAQTQTFSFGSFSDPGALDVSGSTILINADPASAGGPNGGFGFNGLNIPFEATDYQIELTARLLPSNTAGQFNLLLGDRDGNDSGPGLGSEDYNFLVNTADLTSSEFRTVTIPLGSGSESSIVRTFGFNNDGDGLQNFGLSQMQIQASGEDTGVLGLEIERFAIVQRPASTAGDFNGDGKVDSGDLSLLLANWGAGVPPNPSGWTGSLPTAPGVDSDELSALLGNWGFGASTAVPEPSTALLISVILAPLAARRRRA